MDITSPIGTYNKSYYEKLEWLKQSERWSTSEIEAYQNEELRKLFKEAYENVTLLS